MSQIHQCNDGTRDITGRGTPKKYIPCENQGGVVGSAQLTIPRGYIIKDERGKKDPPPPSMINATSDRQRMASGDYNKGKATAIVNLFSDWGSCR